MSCPFILSPCPFLKANIMPNILVKFHKNRTKTKKVRDVFKVLKSKVIN